MRYTFDSVRYLFLDVLLIVVRPHHHDGRAGHGLFDARSAYLDADRTRDSLVVDVLALYLKHTPAEQQQQQQ